MADNRKWREKNPEAAAYLAQKHLSKKRGIPFLLTLDEWLAVWRDSGKWNERGTRSDQYVMARNKDAGPYAAGNVRICTVAENNAEQAKYITSATRQKKVAAAQASATARRSVPSRRKSRLSIGLSGPIIAWLQREADLLGISQGELVRRLIDKARGE